MTRLLIGPDAVLRRSGWVMRPDRPARTLAGLVLIIVLFGVAYGAVMGTFAGLVHGRLAQIAYSAAKVPLLLIATFLISLPSFFVLNTLLGLRRDFGQAMRVLMATQAGLAIVLASFAPLTGLWYASTANYQEAVVFNVLMFACASFSAQWLLRAYYRPLIARSGKHRWLMWSWLAVYALVGIQMGWVLRPFVGSPDAPVQFFRAGAWDNAYVIIGRLVWTVLTGQGQ